MTLVAANPVDARNARAVGELIGTRFIACCESFTAGRVAAALAETEGATAWLSGCLVPYQKSLEHELLGVTAQSGYSETAAGEMATAIAALLRADVAVATTGVAGDEPKDGVVAGTVFVATFVDGELRTATTQVGGLGEEVRGAAATFALGMLRAHLAGETHADERESDDTFEHRQELTTDRLAFDSGYD